MSINLANVNISLQQFQKISSGTYNAGEVKLASENKLAKMNNHVDRTSQNGEKIIDRNAGTINAFNAANAPTEGRIRTSTDIYGIAGMSAENAAKRDAVNAALMGDQRKVGVDEDIMRFQLIVSDSADYVPTDDRTQLLLIWHGRG